MEFQGKTFFISQTLQCIFQIWEFWTLVAFILLNIIFYICVLEKRICSGKVNILQDLQNMVINNWKIIFYSEWPRLDYYRLEKYSFFWKKKYCNLNVNNFIMMIQVSHIWHFLKGLPKKIFSRIAHGSYLFKSHCVLKYFSSAVAASQGQESPLSPEAGQTNRTPNPEWPLLYGTPAGKCTLWRSRDTSEAAFGLIGHYGLEQLLWPKYLWPVSASAVSCLAAAILHYLRRNPEPSPGAKRVWEGPKQ